MNNNQNQNFEALDILALISFVAQVENMNKDAKEKAYIHEVIRTIAKQIEKLHQENDRLESKLNEILNILQKKDNIN